MNSSIPEVTAGRRVIAVDLDGTLIRSDMLIESIFLFLRANPFAVFGLLVALFKGKASFKSRVTDAVAASMVPGGMGAMEAALFIQLTSRGVDARAAISVAIATRLETLRMGMGSGVCALLATASQWRRAEAA
ncbi:MAG: hypothetical protein EON54_03150 [Alcaligenaceae bacterium]|nr:MAG: hypothetical protein EON54_03150 [Alcaligenaceae bacterium]